MEDKEMKEFSRTALLLVTGFCFFVFNKVLQLIDGTHLPVFTWVCVIAILLGSLNSIRTLMERTQEK